MVEALKCTCRGTWTGLILKNLSGKGSTKIWNFGAEKGVFEECRIYREKNAGWGDCPEDYTELKPCIWLGFRCVFLSGAGLKRDGGKSGQRLRVAGVFIGAGGFQGWQ